MTRLALRERPEGVVLEMARELPPVAAYAVLADLAHRKGRLALDEAENLLARAVAAREKAMVWFEESARVSLEGAREGADA
jgi:hypothetical protein